MTSASTVSVEVSAELAECLARTNAAGKTPIARGSAQDEFLERVICGNKVPAVANFLHQFYDPGAAVIRCRIDVLVTNGAMSKVLRYDFTESLKKALLACRAGYFVNRDGKWLDGHGNTFVAANMKYGTDLTRS